MIIDLADELLEIARNKKQYESAIAITALAWNLAILEEQTQRQDALEAYLDQNIKDEQHKNDTIDIINGLINKKNLLYPHINRMIIDFQLVGNKRDFQLNVVSTVTQNDINNLE